MNILNEFLENPLLVSLLYKTFEYKEEIPYKKIDFYEQVYAALFNDHDKTKGSAYVHKKETKLDKYQFEQILRVFGFLCLKSDKVEYSSQLIYQLLKQSIERFGWLKVSVNDFLYDIVHAVPFIQKDGIEYKWVHKSFMEYFASCFICYDNKESEEKYLKTMTTSENSMKFYNVLDFCYEIDTLNFRKYAILPFINAYIEKYNNHFACEYFNDFDKQALHIAKHLVALDIELDVINNSYIENYVLQVKKKNGMNTQKEMRQMFSKTRELFGLDNKRMFHYSSDLFLYAFNDVNSVIYKLMLEKMPELFEELYLDYDNTPLKQRDIKIKFTDDINSPINKDKWNFKTIVENMFQAVFDNKNVILNYDKFKKLREEILLESRYTSNDIFDL